MREIDSGVIGAIPSDRAADRLQQGLALVELFTSIWAANPALARQAGRRVEEFMMPIDEVRLRHLNDLL